MKIKVLLLSCFLTSTLSAKTNFYDAYVHSTPKEHHHYDDENAGGYIIELGLSKPTFTKVNYYSDVYGGTNLYPNFNLAYKFAHIPMVTLVGGFKFSYYVANGKPVLKNSDGTIKGGDSSSTITLKLIPYQFYAMAQIMPFNNRYVVLDLSVGYEELYYEEIRFLNSTVTAANATTTTPTSATPAPKVPNQINDGWNKSITYGVALNFLINHFEEESARSLRYTMGLHYIYVAPFVEVTQAMTGGKLYINQQTTSVVNFSRISYGVLFKFET